MTNIDKDNIAAAYEEVRRDDNDTAWLFLRYEDNDVVLDSTGTDYEEFKSKFQDDERGFGYVRILTGDEMSKRVKFALITWMGSEVSPLKRAKMSTDKSLVKAVISNFAVEIQTNEPEELEQDYVRNALLKAGGANYGTGE